MVEQLSPLKKAVPVPTPPLVAGRWQVGGHMDGGGIKKNLTVYMIFIGVHGYCMAHPPQYIHMTYQIK
jgi:hypothetical protein